MNNAYFFEALEATPVVFKVLYRSLDPAKVDVPTHPNRFTPREVIAHMADWEPILLGRLKAAKATPGAVVQPFDEEQRAVEGRYSELDLQGQLNSFAAARAETVAFLKMLKPHDFDLTVRHPEQGELKLEDMAAMLMGHDHYHLDQISDVLEG